MSKLAQRLLIFFVGMPLVIGLVFIPFLNQLPLHIAICIFSFIGCLELYDIFSKTTKLPPRFFIVTLNTLLPVCAYLCIYFDLSFYYVSLLFMVSSLAILGVNAFFAKSYENSNISVALSILILFYTGFLITFVSRMTYYGQSSYYISIFLFMVFICDSVAWLFGMLFGKTNRGIIKASPNKSIAGFIGGYVGCIAASILSYFIFPGIFHGELWKSILFGAIIATSAIIGDLVESVFKRSADVKDSGVIMPGRGGILDSIDSILFSAPIFYLALHFIFELPFTR